MVARIDDFHRLESRLRLTGSLTTRTALRIGGGNGDLGGADLPVLKDAAGWPIIPGGSLKGALRSTIESLVRGVDARAAGLWACDPLSDQDTLCAAKSCGYHERGERGGVDPAAHCAVCQLFGSHIVASHVRFSDAMVKLPRERGYTRIPVEVRDGVAIDRDLRRARDKAKFDFEVVAPGTPFEVEVFVENPRPWLLGLLVMGFDQVAEGFTALGGFTSRGLGRVSLDWSSLVRVTADELLRGEPAPPITGDRLAAELRSWRDALAAKYREVV